MIIIESLKDYIGKVSEKEFITLATKIYMITDFISSDYPQNKEWYFTKQLPETINSNKRNILFVRNPANKDEIIAVTYLKKDKEENKICTLYVQDNWRNMKIGTTLLNESIKWLGTTKPLITMAEYKLEMFKPFINKYNWELMEVSSNLYNNKFKELCFNGTLTKHNEEPLKQQLNKRLIKALEYRKKQIKL